jgi:hypothetical protein
MLWGEVKKWAKSYGYETIKEKGDEDKGEKVQYYWSKIDNPASSGIANSVSKLAKAIYNDITNNAWLDHQESYISNLNTEIKPE